MQTSSISQLSNQAQASVDGDSSLPAESAWPSNDDNNRLRFPTRHLSVITPPIAEYYLQPSNGLLPVPAAETRMRSSPARYIVSSTPPPPPSEHVLPISDVRMTSSPPLNPWNPYLRSYGRIYPYSLQYDNSARNWIRPARENERSLPVSRIHMEPTTTLRDYDANHSLPIPDEGLLRDLSLPRSNRSFHHYRNGGRDMNGLDEDGVGYSSLPVIEISSDEEDPRPMPADFFRPTDRNGMRNRENRLAHLRNKYAIIRPSRRNTNPTESQSTSPSPLSHRVSSASGLRRVSFVSESNGLLHIKNAYSDENISSSANHRQMDSREPARSQAENRLKRPRRHLLHGSSKHYRTTTPDSSNSNSSDESARVRKKPIIGEIDSSANNTTNAPTQQSVEPNDSTVDNNAERKFKIRIKSEFKCEPKSTEENESKINRNDDDVVDTKENLQPLIAGIKKE